MRQYLRLDNYSTSRIVSYMAFFVLFISMVTISYKISNDSRQCCDADAYLLIAEDVIKNGIFNCEIKSATLRTYLYPVLLIIPQFSAKQFGLDRSLTLFLFQLFCYISATLAVGSLLKRLKPICTYWMLGCAINFLILPYLGIALTEVLSLCFTIIFMGLGIKLMSSDKANSHWTWLLTGLAIGAAIMIRPGNIYLFLPAFMLIATVLINKDIFFSKKVMISAFFIVGAGLTFLPQILINVKRFNQFTIMPVYRLGDYQINAGKTLLKYATGMTDVGGFGISYFNPFWEKASDIEGVKWYFSNIFDGFRTVLMHVFAVFDFDSFEPYVHHFDSPFRWVIFLYCHLIIFFGIRGGFDICRNFRSMERMNRRIILFTLLMCSGWLSVHALVAVENRFALPIYALLFPLAVFQFLKDWQVRRQYMLWGWLVGYLVIAFVLSKFLSGLMVLPE